MREAPPQFLPAYPGYRSGVQLPLMRPEGLGTSGVLCLGESLGDNEQRDRLPFRPYAEAGSVLERALFRAGIQRDSLLLSNLVWYQPPNNWLDGAPYEMDAIYACRSLNDDLVKKHKPRVILALGGLPFRELTGLQGKKQGITNCRGFIVQENLWWPEIPVIGTNHPSYLRRGSKERQKEGSQGKVEAAGGGTQGMGLLGALIRDLQLAVWVAKHGVPQFKFDDYKLGASLQDWETLYRFLSLHPEHPICYDFETQDSFQLDSEEDVELVVREVTQVQISWRIGQSIVSPWNPDLLPIFRKIMSLPNAKFDWNGRKFDRPLNRELEIPLAGELHDVMDFWHHAQPDLPKGLQFATSFVCPEVGPWKHLSGSNPLYYGALDVDMPQRIFKALRTSLSLVREIHSGVSLFEGYQNQVVELVPILDNMSGRGIPVSEDKRQALGEQFGKSIGELESQMQAIYPEHLRNLHPKEGYKRDPLPLRDYQRNLFEDAKELGPRVEIEETNDEGEVERVVYVRKTFNSNGSGTERWAKLLPFSPGSPDQVLNYIKHQTSREEKRLLAEWDAKNSDEPEWVTGSDVFARRTAWMDKNQKWYVPRDYKTGRETTAEMELERLVKATRDPLLPLVQDFRELQKAKSTYVEGWKPREDGRVHPWFGFKPATPQLSSERPNAQNFPVHADIAHAMNRMIEAKPGHRWVKMDWKSFHVLTLGFEASDVLYCRMARIDMHSFFCAAGLLKLKAPEHLVDMEDKELAEYLGWLRKSPTEYSQFGGWTFGRIRDYKAKRAILAYGFGQQERSLYMLNRESYASQSEAKGVIDTLDGLFPKPLGWKREVTLEADRNAYLLTRFGHVRRFYDVFHRKPVERSYQAKRGEIVLESRENGRRWLLRPGDDHEAVIAYRPAADALGMKRHVMVELGKRGWDEKYRLCLELHDALFFECPDGLVDACIGDVRGLMEAPCKYLIDPVVAPQGLWCQVDVSVGDNWDGMEKIK